jgi:hypothetical protein
VAGAAFRLLVSFCVRMFSKRPYYSVKTGFNSRIGFYNAVAFEATAERAGWVLSSSVSDIFLLYSFCGYKNHPFLLQLPTLFLFALD